MSGSLEGGITPTLPSGRELRVGGTTAKYKTPVGDKRIEKYQYEHILKRFKDQTKPWDCPKWLDLPAWTEKTQSVL